MSEEKKRVPIGLQHAICPICNYEHVHGGVAIGKIAVPELTAKKKEELLAQPNHFAPCQDCKEKLDLGYLGMIEFDPRLTIDDIPFRTGRLLWMQQDMFKDVFNHESYVAAMERKAVYVDPEVFGRLLELQESNDGNTPAENGGNQPLN